VSAAANSRSRLAEVPDHDLIDPAGLRNEPCRHCGGTTWLLERSSIDRSAFRIRCSAPLCGRVLVTAHGLTRRPPTGHLKGTR
jgi:hypothetical protein